MARVAGGRARHRRGQPHQLEDCYASFGYRDDAEEEIEVATVRYKHALRRLQAAIPEAVPELVLEPQMATEQNSAPCPYGFGRLVRRPWELHLPWATAGMGACAKRFWARAMRRCAALASAGGSTERHVMGPVGLAYQADLMTRTVLHIFIVLDMVYAVVWYVCDCA